MRAEDGASAVEFGLLAPVLMFGLLAMADVGFALYERMTMNHVLRGGAQSAMDDPGESAVLKVLETTASKNFDLAIATEPADGDLALSVERYHACPDDPNEPVAPTTTCPGPTATSIYYALSAGKTYQGILMSGIDLGAVIQIQIR